MLTSALVLMLDPALQTRLLTDASDLAVSAILKQQDDAGVFHPVAFESCKPTQPERQYTPHLFELLAAVQALKTLRPYLLDTPFELHMDNASLQWLQQQCYVSHHQARWCARCCRLVRTNASGAGRSLVDVQFAVGDKVLLDTEHTQLSSRSLLSPR